MEPSANLQTPSPKVERPPSGISGGLLRLTSAADLIVELANSANSQSSTVTPVFTEPGAASGTYAAKELVYAYAPTRNGLFAPFLAGAFRSGRRFPFLATA